MKKGLLILLLLITSIICNATTYYTSTTGSDSNTGTLASPFKSWYYSFNKLTAGDTLFIRGGTYKVNWGIKSISYAGAGVYNRDGTDVNYIVVSNYVGETPILDADTTAGIITDGIWLSNCSYWHIIGLTVKNVKQSLAGGLANGYYFRGCDNIILERCIANNCQGAGFRTVYYDYEDGEYLFKNCDSYDNYDPYTTAPNQPGGQADGFVSYRQGIGAITTWRGCRAWSNSDDGFDCYGHSGYVVIDSCWSWGNGINQTLGGTGFKLGPVSAASLENNRMVTNCIAAVNRAIGFGRNARTVPYEMHLYNNTAYANWYHGFDMITNYDDDSVFLKNNVSLLHGSYNFRDDTYVTDTYNSWNGFDATVADFLSIDTTLLETARNAQGYLPTIDFLKLTSSSDMRDVGIDVGIAYVGVAPDLGAWEYGAQFPPVEPLLSTVISYDPYYLTSTTAFAGGNVTDDGGGTISERGICWNTTGDPTTSDDKEADELAQTGEFDVVMTGLIKGRRYYIRAYATNEVGTSYGQEMIFRTQVLYYNGKRLFHDGKLLYIR